MAKAPQGFLGYTALLGDPVPSKWDRVKQALWDTNLNAPIRGFYNLMNTPYDVLAGDTGAAGQQAVADSFDAAGGVTVGSMPMPKPANYLSMGLKMWHGSPKDGLTELRPSSEGTGALGPGVYGSPFDRTASNYGPNMYEFEAPDNMFLGSGQRWDEISSNQNPFQIWRDQVSKLVEANPEHADAIKAAGAKTMNDGYGFFKTLAYHMGSKEAAQTVFKKAGYEGLTAMVDGPEAVVFGSVPVKAGGK